MTDLLDKARALEAQLRADDAAMTPGRWIGGADCVSLGRIDGSHVVIAEMDLKDRHEANAFGIARTRNALPAIADTLRDLSAEVEQMRTQRDEAVADGVLSQRVCDIENDRAQLTTERDSALARVKGLEAELLGIAQVSEEEGWPDHAERLRAIVARKP